MNTGKISAGIAVLSVVALTACSSGNSHPTGAEGDADSTICTAAPIGYTQEITASVMQDATPALASLVTTWEGDIQLAAALEPGAQEKADAAQADVTDWCTNHGF